MKRKPEDRSFRGYCPTCGQSFIPYLLYVVRDDSPNVPSQTVGVYTRERDANRAARQRAIVIGQEAESRTGMTYAVRESTTMTQWDTLILAIGKDPAHNNVFWASKPGTLVERWTPEYWVTVEAVPLTKKEDD